MPPAPPRNRAPKAPDFRAFGAKKLVTKIPRSTPGEVTFNAADNSYVYQERKLKNFEASERTEREIYRTTIAALSDAISGRFESLSSCPVFRNLVAIVDCTKWPTDLTQLQSYGDSNMTEPLLEKNSCEVAEISAEWDTLKNRLRPGRECLLQANFRKTAQMSCILSSYCS